MIVGDAARLVGLWEQAGTLHPTSDAPVPWPEGSLNASVREFFRFFEDGTFIFGRFLRDAEVAFDDGKREFVCAGHTDKILRGRWNLKKNRLTQWFPVAGHWPEVRVVELGDLGNDRFIVNEKSPLGDFVLPVVYQRIARSQAELAPIPESSRAADAPANDPAKARAGERRPWWKVWTPSGTQPLDPARRELVKVLRAARALLARPENDFGWSSWTDAGAALGELDRHIAALEAGSLPDRPDLAVLFLPTGPIQEVSLSSGWGDEFLALAGRFDAAKQRVYG